MVDATYRQMKNWFAKQTIEKWLGHFHARPAEIDCSKCCFDTKLSEKFYCHTPQTNVQVEQLTILIGF